MKNHKLVAMITAIGLTAVMVAGCGSTESSRPIPTRENATALTEAPTTVTEAPPTGETPVTAPTTVSVTQATRSDSVNDLAFSAFVPDDVEFEDAKRLAVAACGAMDRGATIYDLTNLIRKENVSVSTQLELVMITGAAIGVYCPEHLPQS